MDLLHKLSDYRNINLAYERVKNTQMNRELTAFHEQHLFEKCSPKIFTNIKQVLSNPAGFEFQPIEILHKPKKKIETGWEVRPLARLSFYDAVITQCVINIVADYINPLLPAENYGYRLQKNDSIYFFERWQQGYTKFVKQEILALDVNSPYNYLVELDIEQFYPTIRHDLLVDSLSKHIVKPNLLKGNILVEWLEKILSIPRIDYSGQVIESNGIPQGSLYSPVLAMFYIKDIFNTLKAKGLLTRVKYFAYVDDFRFYCESEEQANNIFGMAEHVFSDDLKLTINQAKSGVVKLDDNKKLEAKIMGKASNLNRAINDEVILALDGNSKMQSNLLNLLSEAKVAFGADNEKFVERLNKFVSYRISKLVSTSEEWNKGLNEVDLDDLLNTNLVAMLHVMYITTKTVRDRQRLLEVFIKLLGNQTVVEISYVKYLAFQYLYRWSPSELRLNNLRRRSIVELLEQALGSRVYLKAALSRCHEDWHKYINEFLTAKEVTTENREMMAIFYAVRGNNPSHIPAVYAKKIVNPRLIQTNNSLRFIVYSPFYIDARYLRDESFKNIHYKLFKHKSRKFRTFLRCKVGSTTNSLSEVVDSLSIDQRRIILTRIMEWIRVQLDNNEKIPYSVLDPHYIWLDGKVESLTLYGNPGYCNELLYHQPPSKIWKSALGNLYRCLFDLASSLKGDSYLPYGIAFWQFRLIQLSKARGTSFRKYLDLALTVLSDTSDSSNLPVDVSYIKQAGLYQHYVGDAELVDKLFQIIRYVENSWKNGSKDCFFYTLHNQDHALQLIKKIHLLIEESGFAIFMNKKEAFRLFAACYLHDIAMLSPPSKKLIDNKGSNGFKKFSENIVSLPKIDPKRFKDKITFKALLDIHKHVESYYEALVRDQHPYITEEVLNGDYPNLPLSVAERRDIGLICSAHGWYKKDIENLLTDDLHDGRHPLNLKLLSLLLRIGDLCDVSGDRVSRDVLDRNYSRMDDLSIFHWAKHLSVERLEIERVTGSSTKHSLVRIGILHNYLPNMHLEEGLIKERCKEICKVPSANEVISQLSGPSGETCRFHCIFINAVYRYFFEEVDFINRYFKDKNIPVSFELKIALSPEAKNDFLIVTNRNQKLWAQEFMRNFFLG